jgi:hypothetical protein
LIASGIFKDAEVAGIRLTGGVGRCGSLRSLRREGESGGEKDKEKAHGDCMSAGAVITVSDPTPAYSLSGEGIEVIPKRSSGSS